MPFYRSAGTVPHKRHTQFRKPDGSLYHEEVFGTQGFHGVSSILYHVQPPTRVQQLSQCSELHLDEWDEGVHRLHHFRTREAAAGGDAVSARQQLFWNEDISISVARPDAQMDYFYRNARADELCFVHEGTGLLESNQGSIRFHPGDYLVIPRGTTYRLRLGQGPHRFFSVESQGAIETPRRYRNDSGQLLEHSPFCERDIRCPENLETHDEQGDFEVRVKVGPRLMSYCYSSHPFDLIGWDGYLYPWALSVVDFEPITGRIHQPPPVHQVFEGTNFVVCNFVPRKLDYHPDSIPAPYNHSNIDSDEVIYYVNGNFESRRGIESGSITLHPGGLPHGPHPGAAEASIGKERTDELAVMVDTFRPLRLSTLAAALDDGHYPYSWLGHGDARR